MTEELDNTPSPAGDIPQETLPKPLPAPEETAGEQPAAAPEENSGNAVREEEEAAPVLEQIDINELRKRPLNDLQEMRKGCPSGTRPPSPSPSWFLNWGNSFWQRAMKS